MFIAAFRALPKSAWLSKRWTKRYMPWFVKAIYILSVSNIFMFQLNGAAEARRAHNPEVGGSKPPSAKIFWYVLVLLENFLSSQPWTCMQFSSGADGRVCSAANRRCAWQASTATSPHRARQDNTYPLKLLLTCLNRHGSLRGISETSSRSSMKQVRFIKPPMFDRQAVRRGGHSDC